MRFPQPCAHGWRERADVIFCSASERVLIPATDALVVETRGAASVAITEGATTTELPVRRVETRDTTGAGDTFAGGFIAAEMSGATPFAAAQAGISAAAALLKARAGRKDQ